jgi:hypothetical protein
MARASLLQLSAAREEEEDEHGRRLQLLYARLPLEFAQSLALTLLLDAQQDFSKSLGKVLN